MTTKMNVEMGNYSNPNNNLLPQNKSSKRWSTFQLIIVSFIVAIIVGIASNLDRIIGSNQDESTQHDWPTKFGHNIYSYFAMNESFYTDFNWGSYGGAPTIVHDLQHQLEMEIGSCTNCFFGSSKYELQSEVLQSLSDYMNIKNSSDLVFVDNASHGVNAVLRSVMQNVYEGYCGINNTKTNQTCKLLMFNTAYTMVPETLQWINDSLSAKNENILLTFSVTTEMLINTSVLLEALEQFILDNTDDNSRIYLAVISHITAFPAVIYDVKSMLQLLHEYNILGLIDGAHSLGQVSIDIEDMNPDFFVVTGYKWFYAPLSSGCLYARHELQSSIVPTVVSNLGQGQSAYQKYFSYQGTMQYSAWIAMKYAMEFRRNITQSIGGGSDDEINKYIHDLVVEGGKLVASIWNTSLLIEREDIVPNMVNIVLPSQDPADIYPMFDALSAEGVFVRGGPPWEGQWFIRLSGQIFLELSDFENVARVVLSALTS